MFIVAAAHKRKSTTRRERVARRSFERFDYARLGNMRPKEQTIEGQMKAAKYMHCKLHHREIVRRNLYISVCERFLANWCNF